MKRGRDLWLASILALGMCPVSVHAQLEVLSVREAESLIELIPAVRSAKQRGRCPDFSVAYLAGRTIMVQVRGACPDPGTESTLISNYVVDRGTGVVKEGEATGAISTPEMEQLRRELVVHASDRGLSHDEARCLALTAFKSRVVAGESGASFAVQEVARPADKRIQFSVQQYLPDRRMITAGLFSVDTSWVRVRDEQTGMEVISPDIAALAGKMLAVRFPPRLSVDAAVAIALQTPLVARQLSGDCLRVFATGSGTSNEVYIGVISECSNQRAVAGPIAAVDIETGAVRDPRKLREIGSEDSKRTAGRLLRELNEQQIRARSEVASACRSQ